MLAFAFSSLAYGLEIKKNNAPSRKLIKIPRTIVQRYKGSIEGEIFNDAEKFEKGGLLLIDDQAFDLGKLRMIPFRYISEGKRNQICMLAVFNGNRMRNVINLYAEKSDGDEVVARCVNVLAVKKNCQNLLFLIRLNIGQQQYNVARNILITNDGLEGDDSMNSLFGDKKFESIYQAEKLMIRSHLRTHGVER